MDEKVNYYKERKTTKEFKSRRNKLSKQENTQTLRKEANEGVTYASSVGVNLNTSNNNKDKSPVAFDLPSEISVNELKRYEELVPPHTPKPKTVNLSFDLSKNYYFVLFDTETTCTGKQAELCQISAITEDGRKEFSTFILPKSNISYGAYLVNGLTIKKINGSGTLCKANSPVQSVSTDDSLRNFLTFLRQVENSQDNNCVPILLGHNSATFDVPILLRNSDTSFKDNLIEINVHFADSQHLMKELIEGKHKALELEKGGFCKPNQGSLYTHLLNEQFDAHDALEDVRALRRIIFDSSLNLSRKTIVENSNVTAVPHALENMLYLDRRHEILQTFRNKLFNESDENGPITKSMAQNIAGRGLSNDDLRKLYITSGKRGIVAILSNPPSIFHRRRHHGSHEQEEYLPPSSSTSIKTTAAKNKSKNSLKSFRNGHPTICKFAISCVVSTGSV